MAFVTKTWKDRMVEYAGRRKLKNVATGEEVLMDVSRSEGTVSQAGDAFSAANMNNLEQRIKKEFDTVNSSLTANGSQLCMDYHDGKYGVNTDPQRGADTFIPFHSNHKIKTQTLTLYPSRTANPSPNPTWIFDKLERVDGVLSVSSVYGYMSSGDKGINSFSIGFRISGNKVIMSTGLPSEWSYGQGYTCTAFMIED